MIINSMTQVEALQLVGSKVTVDAFADIATLTVSELISWHKDYGAVFLCVVIFKDIKRRPVVEYFHEVSLNNG